MLSRTGMTKNMTSGADLTVIALLHFLYVGEKK